MNTSVKPAAVATASASTEAPMDEGRGAHPSSSTADHSRVRTFFRRLGRDLGYLLLLGPIAAISFSLLLTFALVSFGTIVVWIGVPLGVGTLWLARGFAALERARLRPLAGAELPALHMPPPEGSTGLRRFLLPLRDAQAWRDLAHGVGTFPVAILSWTIIVVWVALALGGMTAAIWHRWLPAAANLPGGFVTWFNSAAGQTVVGVVALVTLPWVARGLAALHLSIGRLLLSPRTATSLSEKIHTLEMATHAAAAAETGALRRLERDVHDGPQQQLVRLAIDIQRAERKIETDPDAAREALASARELAGQALSELRALTRGIAPPLLAERGLCAAISSLAECSTIPVDVECVAPRTLPIGVETAVYFVVAETLANVAKHADADCASVVVTVVDGTVTVRVADDGRGGAHIAKGQGLAGLAERVHGVGGTLAVSDGPRGGTVVTAEVPCG